MYVMHFRGGYARRETKRVFGGTLRYWQKGTASFRKMGVGNRHLSSRKAPRSRKQFSYSLAFQHVNALPVRASVLRQQYVRFTVQLPLTAAVHPAHEHLLKMCYGCVVNCLRTHSRLALVFRQPRLLFVMLHSLELEAARRDLLSANATIAALPTGLVKQRLETALRGVDSEIQSQLWRHLDAKKQSSLTGPQGQQQQQQQQQEGQSARGAQSGGVSSGGAKWDDGPLSPTATVLSKVRRSGRHSLELRTVSLGIKHSFASALVGWVSLCIMRTWRGRMVA